MAHYLSALSLLPSEWVSEWVSESCSVMSNSLWPHGIVHGILQARILEWVAVPFCRGSSQPRPPVLQVFVWRKLHFLAWESGLLCDGGAWGEIDLTVGNLWFSDLRNKWFFIWHSQQRNPGKTLSSSAWLMCPSLDQLLCPGRLQTEFCKTP